MEPLLKDHQKKAIQIFRLTWEWDRDYISTVVGMNLYNVWSLNNVNYIINCNPTTSITIKRFLPHENIKLIGGKFPVIIINIFSLCLITHGSRGNSWQYTMSVGKFDLKKIHHLNLVYLVKCLIRTWNEIYKIWDKHQAKYISRYKLDISSLVSDQNLWSGRHVNQSIDLNLIYLAV